MSADDLTNLGVRRRALAEQRRALEDEIAQAIRDAREQTPPVPWAEISKSLGIQNAQVWLSNHDRKVSPATRKDRRFTSLNDIGQHFGITPITVVKRLADPESEVAKAVTVVPPKDGGTRRRYILNA